MLPRLKGFLQRLLRRAAEGRSFLLTCAALAFTGTCTAGYPVTAIVVPATLLAPQRWKAIALAATLGSALAATALVIVIHHAGWSTLYAHYPQLAGHPDWLRVMSWAAQYGTLALFLVALSPLPQTPALIFFGIARPDYLGVLLAVFAGKLIKYSTFAWITRRAPALFQNGTNGRRWRFAFWRKGDGQ